jgi:chorismate-pyruvate lyase
MIVAEQDECHLITAVSPAFESFVPPRHATPGFIHQDGKVEDQGTETSGIPRLRPPSDRAAAALVEALADPTKTVTEVLEDLVKEPVTADKLDQVDTTATDGNRLSVEAGYPLTRRVTLLRGERSSHPYLFADTLIVTSRLPHETWRRLADGNEPIGRVIVEEGLSMERADITPEGRPLGPRPLEFTGEVLYARRYRLDIRCEPVMEIAEWFLTGLAEFLGGPLRSV